MKIYFLLLLCLFLSIILEATVIHIPLTFVILLIIAMTHKKNSVFFLAIIAGFIVDSLTFRVLGVTSVFFLSAVGILFLYGRKYETHHISFASVFLFTGSLLYEFIFGLTNSFLATLLATLIGVIILLPLQLLDSNQPQRIPMV